jgi:hypothetical protein
MPTAFFRKQGAGYCAAVLGLAVVTAICAPLHRRSTETTAAAGMLVVALSQGERVELQRPTVMLLGL